MRRGAARAGIASRCGSRQRHRVSPRPSRPRSSAPPAGEPEGPGAALSSPQRTPGSEQGTAALPSRSPRHMARARGAPGRGQRAPHAPPPPWGPTLLAAAWASPVRAERKERKKKRINRRLFGFCETVGAAARMPAGGAAESGRGTRRGPGPARPPAADPRHPAAASGPPLCSGVVREERPEGR